MSGACGSPSPPSSPRLRSHRPPPSAHRAGAAAADGARSGARAADQRRPPRARPEAARDLGEALGRSDAAHARDGRRRLLRARVVRLDAVLEAHRALVPVEEAGAAGRCGENLVYSLADVSADAAVEMWMDSPAHRANMLSRSWREIGDLGDPLRRRSRRVRRRPGHDRDRRFRRSRSASRARAAPGRGSRRGSCRCP